MCCVLEAMWLESVVSVLVPVVVQGVLGGVKRFGCGFCVVSLSSALETSYTLISSDSGGRPEDRPGSSRAPRFEALPAS